MQKVQKKMPKNLVVLVSNLKVKVHKEVDSEAVAVIEVVEVAEAVEEMTIMAVVAQELVALIVIRLQSTTQTKQRMAILKLSNKTRQKPKWSLPVVKSKKFQI